MTSKNVVASKSETSAKKSASKKNVKSKHAHTEGATRVAIDTRTNKALKFVSVGAFGGRGARTSAIENFIVKSKRPVSVREIEDATHARAVAMHVRTLYAIRNVVARKIDDKTGAYVYFVAKTSKKTSKK